ncbi:MAG: DNA-processing protein DprA [Anaerolineaceae bacterium]|nr:MAG: DNA-processing protein DprA [Anaerolineaceae bacterium]
MGGKTFRALLDHFGDVPAILAAPADELQQVRGIGAKIAAEIGAVDVADVARRMGSWQENGVRIVTWADDDYPPALAQMADAPPVLFVRGQLPSRRPAMAIVGTREPHFVSIERARNCGYRVARMGGVVISGLARGIDTAAHRQALTEGGQTVAVLGSGVLNIYPPENVAIATAMIERGGGLLCEVAPDAMTSPAALVARNRLITALADVVIVVETGTSGGAMHAVRFARNQGRTLYTFKHWAEGNKALIADGVRPLDENLQMLDGAC